TMLGMRSRRKAILLNMLVLFTAGNLFSALAPTHELLLAARFIAGLPHGVFFGIGAVVAANLVTQDKRAQAISMMFIGLTVANIVGVPAGTLLGQQLGWRWAFALVALIGVVALGAVAALVPNQPKPENVSVRGELRAFRRPQVW
ncbi:MFS transporter, partial [Klebsiella pneumoniae]|nr:MFS transporter [Klebsiella pneumoniae]